MSVDLVLIAPALFEEGQSAPGDAAATDEIVARLGAARIDWRERAVTPWQARLAERLGLDVAAGRALPAAALLWPEDVGGTAPADVAVADPVGLVAARDGATLLPPETLALGSDELGALADAANALLADDGLALVPGASGRLYLRGAVAGELATPPTRFVARRGVAAHLADAAPAWRRLASELEMLWHAATVNEARAARGAVAVNGAWLWGAAAAPEPHEPAESPGRPGPSAAAVTVLASDPLALALARHAGAQAVVDAGGRARASADAIDARRGGGDATGAQAETAFARRLAEVAADRPDGATLIVVALDAEDAWLAGDAGKLAAARAGLCARWLEPAARALADGRVGSLALDGDEGRAGRVVAPRRRWWPARWFARS